MPNINIEVAGKIATNLTPGVPIVCGNSDYTVTFTFDDEWTAHALKTARFVYVKNGEVHHIDKVFTGTVAEVPKLSEIVDVYVGVFAGDLRTSTPARVTCYRSILCGGGTHEEPAEDVYNQIVARCNEIAGAAVEHIAVTGNPHKTTAADVGAVPTTRKINGKALSGDVSLSAADVGARPDTWTPSAADVGARPDTWTPSAADVGARPDTWTPSVAEIGAAPAGYGLGEAKLISMVDIDSITFPGWYYSNESAVLGGFDSSRWYIHVMAYGIGTTFCKQEVIPGTSYKCKLVRYKRNGNWGEWEWENPPMLLGTEYRTTERYNGKAVYRKLIVYTNSGTLGSADGVAYTAVPHGISGLDKLLWINGKVNNYLLPYMNSTGGLTLVNSVSATNIFIDTNNATWTDCEWLFDVAYTKAE